jgi:DNA-directed RNA polymerase specialized sigma24 family protein
MRNYNEFPQLAQLSRPRKTELIALACLSRTDETIARMRLIDGFDYIEIGAEVNMDRTGVSKRLRKTIVPRLEKFM